MIRSALVSAAMFFAFEANAFAEPVRLLVAVGHRSGHVGEAPLRHAARDAERVRDLFVELGGIRRDQSVLLQEPTQAELFGALERLATIARARRREDVSLVFYFSGHGDREAIHLGGERVSLRDLDAKLSSIPAALRITVTDACRTSDVRGKGVTSEEPFAIRVDANDTASGVIRMHASADGEIAQESDELGGAVFTHYWLSGLAGAADANGDARVTFNEAYAFAYSQTLFRSARASGVVQRPAMQSDLVEGAPIVLTQTSNATSIRLPRANDVHYVVYGVGSRTVVGELWSSPERDVSLAVAPGKYIVQRRANGHSAATQFDLARNEQRDLHASDFRAVPEEALARKGGELVLDPHELSLGYSARTGTLASIGHEFPLRYRYAWENFAIGVGAIGGFGSKSRPDQESNVAWLGSDALAELRVRFGTVLLRIGGGPRVVGFVQSLARTDAERLSLAGYSTDRTFRGIATGGHAVVGTRFGLGSRFFVDLDAQGDLLAARVEGSLTPLASVGLGAALGLSL